MNADKGQYLKSQTANKTQNDQSLVMTGLQPCESCNTIFTVIKEQKSWKIRNQLKVNQIFLRKLVKITLSGFQGEGLKPAMKQHNTPGKDLLTVMTCHDPLFSQTSWGSLSLSTSVYLQRDSGRVINPKKKGRH